MPPDRRSAPHITVRIEASVRREEVARFAPRFGRASRLNAGAGGSSDVSHKNNHTAAAWSATIRA